jgi:hypothetical protein
VIVTAHQPNFIPGLSVVNKIKASDAVIWVDEVDYSHFSWTARNMLSTGQRLVVPLRSESRHGPINRVEIAPEWRWREKLARTLTHCFGRVGEPYAAEVRRPYGLLVGLNAALLRLLLADLDSFAAWHWQSQLLGGRPASVEDDRAESGLRRGISYQLAAMVAEVGGDVYLSGPSGRRYLDEAPFAERGIRVDYYEHVGPNPCALELLRWERGAAKEAA